MGVVPIDTYMWYSIGSEIIIKTIFFDLNI